jgi:putative peptide zinc metalloprotease protein
LLALALVAGLAYVWWPREGAYRPIQPYEGGTLTQVAAATRPPTSGLSVGDYGRITTGWAKGDPRPTRDKPQLALVLVPRDGSGTGGESGSAPATGAGSGATPESWVFPFNQPLEPKEGDNQALAVNTKDNTIRYDVAFALVWFEDDSPALNENEAYAFASCSNCAAVAIGFQVVPVTGEIHVAVPQNISAAVNYICVYCLTYALPTLLFVTLDGPLSEAGTRELNELWREIAAFGTNIATVPLNEIRDRLTEFEGRILDIIEADQASRSDESETAGDGDVVDAGDADQPGEETQPEDGTNPSTEPAQEVNDGDVSAPEDDAAQTGDDGTAGDTEATQTEEQAEEPADESAPTQGSDPTTAP